MKNQTLITKTAFAVVAGLLLASASALAQIAPPTPAQAAGPSYYSGNNDSFVVPRTTGPNLYLEGGITYMNAKASGSESVDFGGGNIAFGWRINKNNKLQVELGALVASTDYYVYDGGVRVKVTEDDFAMPLLVSYSYCIPLDPKGRWELRLTPTAGFYTMTMKIKGSGSYAGYYGSVSDDDTDASFAWGGGAGVTCHINKRFYLDAGYRYLRAGSTEYNLFGETLKLDALNTHAVTVSFGWKF